MLDEVEENDKESFTVNDIAEVRKKPGDRPDRMWGQKRWSPFSGSLFALASGKRGVY